MAPRPPASLVSLAELLGGDAKLRRDVRLAFESPVDYFRTHRKELAKRGALAPVEDMAYLALLNGLEARRRCERADWKEYPVEIRTRLERLAPKRNLFAWTSEALEDASSTASYVARCVRELGKRGFALLSLIAGSDEYAFVIVPSAKKAEALRLARAAGYPIVSAERAITTRAKRVLFRPLRVESAPRVTPAMWKRFARDLGPLPISDMPKALRWHYQGTLAIRGERVRCFHRVVGWPAIDHAVLTNRRVSFVQMRGGATRGGGEARFPSVRVDSVTPSPDGTLRLVRFLLGASRVPLWVVVEKSFLSRLTRSSR